MQHVLLLWEGQRQLSAIMKECIHLEIVSSDPLVKVCTLKYISTL